MVNGSIAKAKAIHNTNIGITTKKLCEVSIHFKVPKEKRQHILNARDELLKAGITFDTGASLCREFFEYDWEFDWSLNGGVEVDFKRFKNKET